MNILIADDSEIIRKNLEKLIKPYIAESVIYYATNVDEAISNLNNFQFDTMILDIRMPGGTGFDVLREAKKKLPSPMVIMLTNYATETYRKEAIKEGADYFFDKSSNYEELITVLDKESHKF